MITIPKKEPLNIVPFIDIMLVLLAMVLSVSTFIAKGEIAIELPESKSASSAQERKKQTLLQLDAEGNFHWNDELVPFEAIEPRLEALPREELVLLRIDKSARFDQFIRVIDLFKTHRHENFTIATEKTE